LTKKRLLIVPDGLLHFVPFAALPAPGSSTPLALGQEMVLLPSASALAALRARGAARLPPSGLLAVLADPIFGPTDPRLSRVALAGRPTRSPALERSALAVGLAALPRVPFSQKEARSIVASAPAGEHVELLGFAASRDAVLGGRLSRHRFIHIASHTLLNSEEPEFSGVVLSAFDDSGRPVNPFLQLDEIFGLALPAELVVLSGCRTALGKNNGPEGLMSLSHAFLYAGASRVLASLWKVDDEATAELMALFYKGLFGSQRLSPAAALRQAQLEIAAQPRWRSPYFWAGFVLQGEWR